MSKISPLAQRAPGFNRLVRNNSSGVTKGQRMFVELGDARSAWARRWADLIVVHVSDLGGPETLSEAQVSICRRAAATEIALEQIEARMSEGQQIDLDQYGRLTGRACRMLELVGVKRVTRAVDPTGELARAYGAAAPIDDDDDDGDENEPAAIEEDARASPRRLLSCPRPVVRPASPSRVISNRHRARCEACDACSTSLLDRAARLH